MDMKRFVYIYFAISFTVSLTSNAQDGLVGYWNFDNFSDEIIRDQTENSNDGTGFGAYNTIGIKGFALGFNGTDSYAKISRDGKNPPAVLSNLGQGSISVWFKVDNIPTENGIAPIFYYGSSEKCDYMDAANQGLIIEIGHSPIYPGSESLFFTIWKNGCTNPSFCFDSNHPITKGVWHHFVAVVGEDYNTGYFDGKEMVDRDYNFGDDSYSQFFEDALAPEELWLGKGHWDRTEQFFDGAIDELKIFNKALSTSEIQSLFTEVNVTSTENIELKTEVLKVYPNPASERLFFDFSRLDFNIERITFIDITGKQIILNGNIQNSGELNLEQIPAGLYSVSFVGKEKTVLKKVIVIK